MQADDMLEGGLPLAGSLSSKTALYTVHIGRMMRSMDLFDEIKTLTKKAGIHSQYECDIR